MNQLITWAQNYFRQFNLGGSSLKGGAYWNEDAYQKQHQRGIALWKGGGQKF